MTVYRIPIGDVIEAGIDFFVTHFSFATIAFSKFTTTGITYLSEALMFLPPWAMILIFTGLAWFLSKKWKIGLFTLIGMFLIWNMQLWGPTMSTIALIIIATLHFGGHRHSPGDFFRAQHTPTGSSRRSSMSCRPCRPLSI
jgi:glycine betaine/proline transport system permease protein